MSKVQEQTKKNGKLILAIETSCDETSVALVEDGRKIRANIISSQVPLHRKYGGVVPEIASRKHIENVLPVLEECLTEANVKLTDIDGIGVTYGPGLVGALLVGVCGKGTCLLARYPASRCASSRRTYLRELFGERRA